MKKKKIIALSIIGVFALLSTKSFAQNNPQLTEIFELTFNQENVQKTNATLGISSLNFKSELQSRRFFDAISDNLISFKLDYKRKTVLIELHQRNLKKSWNASEWNRYFANNRKRYMSYYKGILTEK